MYLWFKSFHIAAMVTWFAGLFYLPRLFVYHAMTEDAAGRERFKIMERKLYRGITTPGGIVTVVLGALLAIAMGPEAFKAAHWLHWKLGLVVVLVAYHAYLGVQVRAFARDENQHGHVFYRWINEFPVLILVAAVCLAVLKPL